jgi:hypothetical protein
LTDAHERRDRGDRFDRRGALSDKVISSATRIPADRPGVHQTIGLRDTLLAVGGKS